jgi:hypothetical protein
VQIDARIDRDKLNVRMLKNIFSAEKCKYLDAKGDNRKRAEVTNVRERERQRSWVETREVALGNAYRQLE